MYTLTYFVSGSSIYGVLKWLTIILLYVWTSDKMPTCSYVTSISPCNGYNSYLERRDSTMEWSTALDGNGELCCVLLL